MFKKNKKAVKQPQLNHHFVFIEVPISIVGPQVILWGEAQWWPEKCLMRFIKVTEGDICEGTVYTQKVMIPLIGLQWKAQVSKFIPNRLIQRDIKRGIYVGQEIIRIGERANGTRIDYELHYYTKGLLNTLLWHFIFRKKHDENIEMILNALKEYTVKIYHEEREKELDAE